MISAHRGRLYMIIIRRLALQELLLVLGDSRPILALWGDSFSGIGGSFLRAASRVINCCSNRGRDVKLDCVNLPEDLDWEGNLDRSVLLA